MDKKGVSPMIATIVLIAIVFAIAAILALSLAASPTPKPPFGGNLVIENAEVGKSVILIKHQYGEDAVEALMYDNGSGKLCWKNIEVRYNGVTLSANDDILEFTSAGTKITKPWPAGPTRFFDLKAGDQIRIAVPTLARNDVITIVWGPTKQILVPKTVT